jgi:hypothetical protein
MGACGHIVLGDGRGEGARSGGGAKGGERIGAVPEGNGTEPDSNSSYLGLLDRLVGTGVHLVTLDYNSSRRREPRLSTPVQNGDPAVTVARRGRTVSSFGHSLSCHDPANKTR